MRTIQTKQAAAAVCSIQPIQQMAGGAHNAGTGARNAMSICVFCFLFCFYSFSFALSPASSTSDTTVQMRCSNSSKQANNNKMAKRIVFGSGRRLHCTFSHSSQEMAKNPWNIRGGCCAGMEMPFGECVCGVNWFFAIFAKVCRVCVNVICTTQQQRPTNTIEMQWQ